LGRYFADHGKAYKFISIGRLQDSNSRPLS